VSTNLYLINRTAEYIPPAFRGTWNSNNGAGPSSNILIDSQKLGTNIRNQAGSVDTGLGGVHKHAHTRGVSRRLVPQTISGSVNLVIGVDQNDANNQNYWKLHIYVVNESTGAVHGTLLNNYEEGVGNGTEFSITTNVGKSLNASQTLTSVTIPSDSNNYRIVCELGYITYYTTSHIAGANIKIGARGPGFAVGSFLPDLTVGDTTTLDSTGFFQFSGTITFAPALPPVNKDPETAIELTLPANVIYDPLSKDEIWYKYTPTVDEIINILTCNSDDSAYWNLYSNPPLNYEWSTGTGSAQIWPLRADKGAIYFAVSISPYTSGKTGNLSIIRNPHLEAPQIGDLIISEDEGHEGQNVYDPSFKGKFNYTWYTPSGAVRRIDAHFPATELGCCLKNGKWAVVDFVNHQLFIYNAPPGMAEIGRFGLPDLGPSLQIGGLGTDFINFYITIAVNSVTPSDVYKITESGVVTGPIATLEVYNAGGAPGGGGNSSIGISRDGSIIYYPHRILNGTVRRHNLLTNTPLTSFPAPFTGCIPGDVIVLSDGTIAAIFYTSTTNKVIHYSAIGAILHSWDFGIYPIEIHHIVHEGNDDPDKVWVWTQDMNTSFPTFTGINTFRLVQLSTGTYLKEWTHHVFNQGNGPHDPDVTCNPAERWGAPDSCPLMVVMTVDVPVVPDPTAPDGIYFVSPNKTTRHDSYYNSIEKKIPNPTIKTAVLGE